MNGPAAGSPSTAVPIRLMGRLRAEEVAAGPHRVRILPANGTDAVWSGIVHVEADAKAVVCWDLAAGAMCD